MKWSLRVWAVGALLTSILAAPPSDPRGAAIPVEEAIGIQTKTPTDVEAKADGGELVDGPTTRFNGAEVPPMKEIEGSKFNETIKQGYWYG